MAERSLLVLCMAFRGAADGYANLTVKIPKQVLNRCEWGHDDYSLRVENLPRAYDTLRTPTIIERRTVPTKPVSDA